MWNFSHDLGGSRVFKVFGVAPAIRLVTRPRAAGSLGDPSVGKELSHSPRPALSQKYGQS